MKNFYSLKFLPMAVLSLVLVTGCSTDENQLQESIDASAKMKTSQKSRIGNIDRTERKEKFTYFLNQIDAGTDISSELFNYVNANFEDLVVSEDARMNKNLILAAINPDEYVCDGSDIPLTNYVNSTTLDWTFTEIIYYLFYGDFPVYDAIYFKAPGERQSYGVNGEFTNQLNRTFKDLKRFWNVKSDDIHMFAMKGTTYENTERAVEIEMALYPGQSEEDSRYWVSQYQEVFGSDLFWNYNHPLLSFNAFALSTTDGFVQDRIVMGDGILTGYDAIGLGDVAPQAILAHEYAHQIQFQNGYFEEVAPEDEPAATRRTELMADAYAAYYLTHKKGATMNFKRVEQFMEAFYNIGDCSFDSAGHHGTYEQRLAAAKFGYSLAQSEQKNGQQRTSEEVFELFEDALDQIINCDTCLTK